jgi:hypothetical protein
MLEVIAVLYVQAVSYVGICRFLEDENADGPCNVTHILFRELD